MTTSIIYLIVMLLVISIWFIVFKRPVYEAVFISLILLILLTNSWSNVFVYIKAGLNTSLIFSMISFVSLSILLSKTKIIDSVINIVLVVFGKISGGAGYVSVIASSFMGTLSGSGPGNVMATGTITIPAMKKSGFPAELAANIEGNASYLGNCIPPSSNIVASLGAFTTYASTVGIENITLGRFWIVCWSCAFWFILQRLIMVFIFCKYYKVKPMNNDELPTLKEALKTSWRALLLPVIILLPFVLDFIFKDNFFTNRLGSTGAKYFSSSILIFTAGITAIFALIINKNKKDINICKLAKMFSSSIKSISPAVTTCIFGYMIGELFIDLNIGTDLQQLFQNLNLGKFSICLLIPLISCFLGMVVPGSSLVVMLGPAFISLFASVGVNPMLAAAMLPSICGVMCGITPPLALGMYAGMTLAESDFGKTVKNELWWVFAQFSIEVIILLGFLPILGL